MADEPTHEDTLRATEDALARIEALLKKHSDAQHRLRNLLVGRKDDGK